MLKAIELVQSLLLLSSTSWSWRIAPYTWKIITSLKDKLVHENSSLILFNPTTRVFSWTFWYWSGDCVDFLQKHKYNLLWAKRLLLERHYRSSSCFLSDSDLFQYIIHTCFKNLPVLGNFAVSSCKNAEVGRILALTYTARKLQWHKICTAGR